jgi:membrane protease subunit (stomatin/prohibitin family)
MNRLLFPIAIALVLCNVAAQATQQGQQALRNWKQMDNCARQAQTAYPNFDADSNVKRDAQLKACLNAGNLPPREPFVSPGPR